MKLITINELSKQINIKISTLYAWANSGSIPCYRLGRLLRFDLAEVGEWIKKSKVEPLLTPNFKNIAISDKKIDEIVKSAVESVGKPGYNTLQKGNQTDHAQKGG